MKIENEFIPYTEALKLKELGFNEKCIGIYYNNGKKFLISETLITNSELDSYNSPDSEMSTPLYQQAFRWFREKHEIEATTACYYSKRLGVSYEEREYHCHIIRDGVTSKGPRYKTYEEAELACLKKLIEIIKEK
jgi:hypothetical protein